MGLYCAIHLADWQRRPKKERLGQRVPPARTRVNGTDVCGECAAKAMDHTRLVDALHDAHVQSVAAIDFLQGISPVEGIGEPQMQEAIRVLGDALRRVSRLTDEVLPEAMHA